MQNDVKEREKGKKEKKKEETRTIENAGRAVVAVWFMREITKSQNAFIFRKNDELLLAPYLMRDKFTMTLLALVRTHCL